MLVQARCNPTAPLDFLEKLFDRLVKVSSFRLHVCGCGPKCPCNGGVLIQNVTASILGNLPPRTKSHSPVIFIALNGSRSSQTVP